MKSKISFCKKTLIQNNIKMYGVISLLWGIYLFLRYPLLFLQDKKWISGVFTLNEEIFIFLVPAALGVAFYHFLKTDNGTAFYLSLPMTRTQIYFSQFFSGLILYLVPLVLNILLSLVIGVLRFREEKQLFNVILSWGIAMILLALANYCISIGMGMITGSLIWHILFVIIFYALPVYFAGAVDYFGERLLYGFAGNSSLARFFQKLNIIGKVFSLNRHEIISTDFLLFIGIYAAAAFILAFLLFRYKKMENNRDWIGFGFLKIIFIVGFTLCAVILMTVTLTGIIGIRDDFVSFYIGAALGAILGYIVAAMIAWKTIYLKKAWWGTLLSLAITLAIIGLIDADLFGYERRVPAPEEIESVSITVHSSGPEAEAAIDRLIRSRGNDRKYRNTYEFTENANIAVVEKIHHYVLENRGSGSKDTNPLYFRFSYFLKNGEIVRREYSIAGSAVKKDWQELSKSEEALKQAYPVLKEKTLTDLVGIRVSTEASRAEDSFSGAKMQELLAVIRQEIMAAAKSPEKVNIHGQRAEQVQALEQIPIRFVFVREYKPKLDYKKFPAAEPESTAETSPEEDLVFYGNAPQLRCWLADNSPKYREMTDIQSLVESVEIYRLPGTEVWDQCYWGGDWEKYRQEKIAILTDPAEIMIYLKSAGICLDYPSEEKTMILLEVKLKDGVSYLRAMTEEDYAAVRAGKQ